MTRVEPTQNRAGATRDHLVLLARDLIIENGMENVTSNDVAGAAYVAVGTFYRYFANMGDLHCEYGIGPGQGVSQIARKRVEMNRWTAPEENTVEWHVAQVRSMLQHAGLGDPEVEPAPELRTILTTAAAYLAVAIDLLPTEES